MGQSTCKNCGNPIPESRRSDAIFCCPKCGWDFRNRRNAKDQKEKNEINRKLHHNYKIVTEFYKKGLVNVSIETLESHGFDANYYTKVEDMDFDTKTSVIRIYEYRLTFKNERFKIEKLLI